MPYRLLAGEPVGEGIQRIVTEQIDRAIGELRDRRPDLHEAVHEARKHFKKIRAVLRLVRGELAQAYREENAWFRDLGRELSTLRDMAAAQETLERLAERYADQLDDKAIAAVRGGLGTRRSELMQHDEELLQQVRRVERELRKGRRRLPGWPPLDDGFAALDTGLKRTYRRCQQTYADAFIDPTPERFHAWRKRVKDHWYHTRLLVGVWPKVMKGQGRAVGELADILGQEHDLTGLRDMLLQQPERYGEPRGFQVLMCVADRLQGELRLRANDLGARIYVEKPGRYAARLRQYWSAWQVEQKRDARFDEGPGHGEPAVAERRGGGLGR